MGTVHLVVGAGEVGQAIYSVLKDKHEVYIRDIEDTAGIKQAEVLHVCFPHSENFIKLVNGYANHYLSRLIIIHSTVPVGTSYVLNAVHSPVTGRHPHLEEGVRTFVKFFGGMDDGADIAAKFFEDCGVDTRVVKDASITEAGKLWQTLQFGWLVAMQKEAYRFAKLYHVDPKIMYDEFNEAYNDGYYALGESFILPIIKDMPGRIGGHCVIPNAGLTNTPLAYDLIKYNGTYGTNIDEGTWLTEE